MGHRIEKWQNGISVDQFQYASTLKPIEISKQRAVNKTSELSDKEKHAYSAAVGQLNWIATSTRPDIAFDICELSVSFSRATVSDLLRLNKVVSRVATDNIRLYFPEITPLEECYIECFSDASFANLCDNGSQGAFILFLRDEKGSHCPIYWQTREICRVVKSTLAAETLALLESAEAAVYVRAVLSDLLNGCELKIKCHVDNKSLVDALHSTKSVDDRRLRIDISVSKDMLEKREIDGVSWIESTSQLANCLTKKGASCERLWTAVSGN